MYTLQRQRKNVQKTNKGREIILKCISCVCTCACVCVRVYVRLPFPKFLLFQILFFISLIFGRSQWPRDLRRRFLAARLLRLWVRIPPGAWMFVCCECCVLSGRGLCDGLITRPEESYRLWCVVGCGQETS